MNINKNIYKYFISSITFYWVIYSLYLNIGEYNVFWNTLYFINENIFIINLLIVISNLISSFRIKYFANIVIIFKTILCLIDALTYAGIHIKDFWAEIIVSTYWLIALTYFIYVSSKRIY